MKKLFIPSPESYGAAIDIGSTASMIGGSMAAESSRAAGEAAAEAEGVVPEKPKFLFGLFSGWDLRSEFRAAIVGVVTGVTIAVFTDILTPWAKKKFGIAEEKEK